MIRAWRITHKRHADRAFTGEGAYLYGGRWNPPGYRVIYVSASIALATLEILVQGVPPTQFTDFVYIPVDLPDRMISDLPSDMLPSDWRKDPIPESTRRFGRKWIHAQKFLVLRVPSAVVPEEFNFLINPLHADFTQLKIGTPRSYAIDERLLP